jgi:hypothetical protein
MSEQIHHKLYTVAEATHGTTPATPALRTFRNTGTTLALSKESFQSGEIDGSRVVRDFRHGNKQIGGDINFEVILGTDFDFYLQAALMSTFALGTPGNPDILAVGSTRKPFTAIRHFSDMLEAQKPWHAFRGCEVNKLSLKLVPGKIVTGTISVLGREAELLGTAPTGSTFPAATTEKAVDTFLGSMEFGLSSMPVTELTLNFENNLSPNFVLFSDLSDKPSAGIINLSGEIGMRFESKDMLEAFYDGAEKEVSIVLSDGLLQYVIQLPQCKINGGQPDVSAQTGPIMLKVPFQAIATTGSPITVLKSVVEAP